LIVGVDDGIGSAMAGLMAAATVEDGIGIALASSWEVAMVDPKGTKSAPDGGKVSTENVIGVTMDDLSKKDREKVECELQREIEEEMVEWCKKKLACFQKTRGGMVKKVNTSRTSIPVNAPFTLKELIHMIDVSVSSKYGANLEVITRTLTDSVKGAFESLRLEFKQESKKMPR
jgi:hypothetical protein